MHVAHAVQDGHFVPNLTLGAPVVASLRQHTSAFLDCHLMVSNPRQWVQVRLVHPGSATLVERKRCIDRS